MPVSGPTGGGGSSGPATAEFSGAGRYAPAAFVGQVWINQSANPRTISGVILWHQTAGTSGQTVVDILVNSGSGWTSVWDEHPENRPRLLASAGGDAQAVGGPVDTPSVPPGARVRMDIIQVQAGGPESLYVQVTF